jgi:hypothetical protein
MNTSSSAGIEPTRPCGHAHETSGYLGSDFIQQHRITCTCWNLGTVHNGPELQQQWTLRMQRVDGCGGAHALTWIHDENTGKGPLDWDWVVFLVARDAHDGRLTWDGYRKENDLVGATAAETAAERERWARCVPVWHDVRDFLGDDETLLRAFFDIVPPEY